MYEINMEYICMLDYFLTLQCLIKDMVYLTTANKSSSKIKQTIQPDLLNFYWNKVISFNFKLILS
jgi:hypothetical protein